MTDRERLNKALASVVDFVQPGNICCVGCFPVPDTAVTFAAYTGQSVEQSFSEDIGGKPYEQRARWSDYEDIEDGESEMYEDAVWLVKPLYINYGVRDKTVYTKRRVTSVRKALVKALNAAGFAAEDPGSNDKCIRITAVTDTRVLA